MIRYWLRLHTIDSSQDMLLSEALKDNYSMFENGNSCWLQSIYLTFKEVNMVNVFHNPFSLNKIIFCLQKKLKQRSESKWLSDINNSKSKSSDINNGNKLRTYATFKSQFSCETYINSHKFQERQALAKFRTSAHTLETERGRYIVPKTPVCNRIYRQCNDGSVEDEHHRLLECSNYKQERIPLFKEYEKINGGHFIFLYKLKQHMKNNTS